MGQKRFYWFKVKEDFFDGDGISWLKEQSGGLDAIAIYFELCTRTLKNNGYLSRQLNGNIVKHNIKSLSNLLRLEEKIVENSIQLLQSAGMILIEDKIMYLPDLPNMIGSETSAASAMRQFRANKQSTNDVKQSNNNVKQSNNNVKQSNKNVDGDIDIDIEKEKDIDLEVYRPDGVDNSKNDPLEYYNKHIQPIPNDRVRDEILELQKDYGDEILLKAMEITVKEADRPNMKYLVSVASRLFKNKKEKSELTTMKCPKGWDEYMKPEAKQC